MNLADSASALARTQEWISLGSLTGPAEPTPAARCFTVFLLLIHNGGYVREFFEVLIIAIRED